MKKITIILLSLVLALNLSAQTVKPESINRLLEVSEAEKALSSAYAEMNQMVDGMAEQLGVTETEKPLLDIFAKKIEKLLNEEAGWDKIKGPVADIYAKNFTEEEVQGLIKFYESPSGKAFINKMPTVTIESAQLGQKILIGLMPKIETLAKDFAKELQASREK